MASQSFSGVIEQAIEMHVTHPVDPDHRGQSGKTPRPRKPPLHDHQKQVGNACDLDWNLYGFCALPIKVLRWEVLFHLLEQPF